MAFVQFTRPDGSSVTINSDQVLKITPVPTEGPLMGPLTKGSRIHFINGMHQDVKELEEEVRARLNAGG